MYYLSYIVNSRTKIILNEIKDYFTNADLFVDLQNSFSQSLAHYFLID